MTQWAVAKRCGGLGMSIIAAINTWGGVGLTGRFAKLQTFAR